MDERDRPGASFPTPRRRGFLSGVGASALGTFAVSADRSAAESGSEPQRPRAAASRDGVRQQQRNGLSIGGGSLGYAKAGTTPSLNFSDGLEATIELWIHHDGTSDEDAILLEKNEGNSEGYQISFDGSGEEPPVWFGWKFPNSNNWKVTSNSGIPANTWTHVACVYDGSQQAIYINGELDATRTDWNDEQMNGNDAPFALGANSQGNKRFFSGELDEVRLWNTARSLLQIRESWLTTLSGDEGSLLAYYPFDGGTTADAASANDLELVGSAALASPGALPAPPKLYARAGNGEVSLRWSQRVGPTGQNKATAFRLYRSTTPDGSDRTQLDEFGPDTTTTTVSATNGEIGYYWLSAVDSEDHESDLSYPAVALPASRPFGRALSFPGSDSRVTIDDRPRLDMPTPTETTIEFWVKHDGESAENAILVGKNESNANGYLVSFTGNTVEPKIDFGMKFPNSDNWKLVSTGGVPAEEWTHVACVYDGNKQVIYINGELDSTREDWNHESMNGNSAPLRFGAADETGQRLFSGQLDDVRIWDTPRTIRQIQNNYQRELYGDEDGLLAYWRTADGGTVRGSIGSALTGKLENVDVSQSDFGTTATPTDTPTESPTPTEGETPTPTEGDTPTPTDGPTPTESPTPADGGTPTDSPTPTPTESPTPPPTESPTPTPTESPTPTAGQTATATEGPTATAVPTTAGPQRGFFTNGGNGPLGFLNEVTLTMIGIVISILSIVVEMLGLRGGN